MLLFPKKEFFKKIYGNWHLAAYAPIPVSYKHFRSKVSRIPTDYSSRRCHLFFQAVTTASSVSPYQCFRYRNPADASTAPTHKPSAEYSKEFFQMGPNLTFQTSPPPPKPP